MGYSSKLNVDAKSVKAAVDCGGTCKYTCKWQCEHNCAPGCGKNCTGKYMPWN